MSKRLAKVAVMASAVCVTSFLGSMVIFVTTPSSARPFGEIFSWDGNRPRCTNELGDAGEETTTREFAWNAEDEIRLDVPGVLRYRAGAGDSVEVRGRLISSGI